MEEREKYNSGLILEDLRTVLSKNQLTPVELDNGFEIKLSDGDLPPCIIEEGKLPRTDKHIDLTDEQCLELTKPVANRYIIGMDPYDINLHNRDRILKNINNGL